jgi:hypothetical protein
MRRLKKQYCFKRTTCFIAIAPSARPPRNAIAFHLRAFSVALPLSFLKRAAIADIYDGQVTFLLCYLPKPQKNLFD